MIDIVIKLLLGLVELLSEEAICDVYYSEWGSKQERRCRRLRSSVANTDQ